jgi:hypothetical protein
MDKREAFAWLFTSGVFIYSVAGLMALVMMVGTKQCHNLTVAVTVPSNSPCPV